jgi:citrate lyase subunit beta/citryl-CoA lyase
MMDLLFFVPAYREDYVLRARQLAIEIPGLRIVFDLEDGCPPEERANGREVIMKDGRSTDLYRISRGGEEDLDLDVIPQGAMIIVPKAGPEDFPYKRPAIALIETAIGLEYVSDIAENADGLLVGAGDLAADFGSGELYEYTRRVCLVAGRGASTQIPVYDSPCGYTSRDAIVSHAHQVYRLGFDGVMVLSPDAAKLTYEYARPNPGELDWARTVLAAPQGVSVLSGEIVGPPHRRRARALLDRWEGVRQ